MMWLTMMITVPRVALTVRRLQSLDQTRLFLLLSETPQVWLQALAVSMRPHVEACEGGDREDGQRSRTNSRM